MFRDSKVAPSKQTDYEQLLFELIQEVIENKSLPERLLPNATVVQTEYGIDTLQIETTQIAPPICLINLCYFANYVVMF
jgi:hypothetical protein